VPNVGGRDARPRAGCGPAAFFFFFASADPNILGGWLGRGGKRARDFRDGSPNDPHLSLPQYRRCYLRPVLGTSSNRPIT